MPATTNSIASAPKSIPNIFSITVITVGPIFLDNWDESHMATNENKITITIGKKLIKNGKGSAILSSAISKAAVKAPGPAIKGIDNGKIATD